MEMIREWFEFIRNPGNPSAIVAILTALIFLTSLAYTIFAGLQWREMRKTIKAIQQQIADARAVQAARLTIEFPPPDITERGENIWAEGTIVVTNVGGTAAIEIVIQISHGGGVERPTWPARLDAVPDPHPNGQTLAPTKSLEYPYNMFLGMKADLASGKWYASSLVQVAYRDVFKNPYSMTPCYLYEPHRHIYYSIG